MSDAPTTERRMSLAAGVTPELASDPAEFVRTAASAGWRACGVWFEPETWTAGTTRAVRAELDASGAAALDVEVVRLGQLDPRPLLDAAAELGATNVLCVSFLPDAAETAARYAELCELAGSAGVRACLEFMPFSSVRDLRSALAVVADVGHPAAAVLVDLLHLVRSGGSVADLVGVDPALLPYAQWCDGAATIADTSARGLVADALDGRSCPGEGELPVVGFVEALPPGTPLSLEVRSAALRAAHPDPTDRARAVLASVARSPVG